MIEAAPIIKRREGGDHLEVEERLAYAEAHMSILASDFLAAREAERRARQQAHDVACQWGRAWRELHDAREVLSRARSSAQRQTSAFVGGL